MFIRGGTAGAIPQTPFHTVGEIGAPTNYFSTDDPDQST
jgi:hypothetical protein